MKRWDQGRVKGSGRGKGRAKGRKEGRGKLRTAKSKGKLRRVGMKKDSAVGREGRKRHRNVCVCDGQKDTD